MAVRDEDRAHIEARLDALVAGVDDDRLGGGRAGADDVAVRLGRPERVGVDDGSHAGGESNRRSAASGIGSRPCRAGTCSSSRRPRARAARSFSTPPTSPRRPDRPQPRPGARRPPGPRERLHGRRRRQGAVEAGGESLERTRDARPVRGERAAPGVVRAKARGSCCCSPLAGAGALPRQQWPGVYASSDARRGGYIRYITTSIT